MFVYVARYHMFALLVSHVRIFTITSFHLICCKHAGMNSALSVGHIKRFFLAIREREKVIESVEQKDYDQEWKPHISPYWLCDLHGQILMADGLPKV